MLAMLCQVREPRLLLIGIVMLLGFCHEAHGLEPPPKKDSPKNDAASIAQLASPNSEPTIKNDFHSTVKFPATYDVAAQKRIEEARQVLHEDIETALPYLVLALDDNRYCMTISWADEYYYNFSVGRICSNVIASHLEVYRDTIRFSGPGHWNQYNDPISKKWWDERKGRRLSALQVEAIDWAIAKRKAEPQEFVREGRENEVAELQILRATIAKSGTPAPPRRMLRMITRDITPPRGIER